MALSFTTPPPAKPRTITFDIDGDEFTFDVPKNSVLSMAMVRSEKGGVGQLRALMAWLEAGLSADQYEYLCDRLADPDDGLDNDVLGKVTQALIAEATDRPTQSPSA